MKIDFGSILFIILSIIILAISGLGKKRKKQAQQQRPAGAALPGSRIGEPEEFESPQARKPVMDPFERLEQILTGQSRYESLEGETLEVLEDEEQIIMDEKEKIQSTKSLEMGREKRDLTDVKKDEDVKKNLDGLFGDLNEITRAVIYSEIFPRKYI